MLLLLLLILANPTHEDFDLRGGHRRAGRPDRLPASLHRWRAAGLPARSSIRLVSRCTDAGRPSKQETDCGLAALAMVAGAWGRHWSVDDLAHRLPPGDHGVKLGALRDLARDRGLDAYASRASRRICEHELVAGRPVLLGSSCRSISGHNRAHYEVAIAMSPAGRHGRSRSIRQRAVDAPVARGARSRVESRWLSRARRHRTARFLTRWQARRASVPADGQGTRVQRDARRAHRRHRCAHRSSGSSRIRRPPNGRGSCPASTACSA